jgi:hypothetical protein
LFGQVCHALLRVAIELDALLGRVSNPCIESVRLQRADLEIVGPRAVLLIAGRDSPASKSRRPLEWPARSRDRGGVSVSSWAPLRCRVIPARAVEILPIRERSPFDPADLELPGRRDWRALNVPWADIDRRNDFRPTRSQLRSPSPDLLSNVWNMFTRIVRLDPVA